VKDPETVKIGHGDITNAVLRLLCGEENRLPVSFLLQVTYSRIEIDVEKVYQEVGATKIRARNEHDGLHEGIIAVEDGLNHQAPHARPGENRFNDHRAPMSMPNCMPATVTSGISAFFRACLPMTKNSRSPWRGLSECNRGSGPQA